MRISNFRLLFKIIFNVFILFILVFSYESISKEISNVKIKSLKGRAIETNSFIQSDSPVLILFFSICCNPSIRALEDLRDEFDDLIDEYDLKIILVSIDDPRNTRKIAPLLSSKGIYFDTYLDENSDFIRSMGVAGKPHYIIFDSTGNSIFEKTGYMPNINEEIYDVLK